MADDVIPVRDLDAPGGPSGSLERALPFLWTAVAVLLMTAVAAALFGWADEVTPAQRVAAAAGAVEEAGTVAYSLTMEVSGPFTTSFAIEGAADADAGRSSARFEMEGQTIDLVSDGDDLYVRVPEAARANFGGKPWVRFDASALGSSFGGVSPADSPLETFEQLREAGRVEEVGTEEVRGVETTRYRTVVDQSDLAPAGPIPDEIRAALREVEVEVWIDDDDRIRRHRSTIDLAGVAPGAGRIGITTTIETYDYGQPVTIELPPAGDVAEGGAGGLESIFAPGPPDPASSAD